MKEYRLLTTLLVDAYIDVHAESEDDALDWFEEHKNKLEQRDYDIVEVVETQEANVLGLSEEHRAIRRAGGR